MYNRNRSVIKFDEKEISPNVVNEYARQKLHLQACVEALKKKLIKQSNKNQNKNLQIMNENIQYMSEIQELRKELKQLTQVKHNVNYSQTGGGTNAKIKKVNPSKSKTEEFKSSRKTANKENKNNLNKELKKRQLVNEFEATKSQISSLQEQITQLEQKHGLGKFDENA